MLLLLLLSLDEELVWSDLDDVDDEETSPTMVRENVPPHPMAGSDGNQGERFVDPDDVPKGSGPKAEAPVVVGGNTEGGNVDD